MSTYITGYSVFANFSIVFCAPIDALLEWRLDNIITESMNITADGLINVQTGKQRDVYGSGNKNSNLYVYFGDHVVAPPMLVANTGYDILYKNLFMISTMAAFIGDDVKTMPAYSVIVKKTSLIADGVGGKTWSTISNLNVSDTYADANPVIAMLYIMREMLQINDIYLDFDNIFTTAQTVYNEGIGCSFVMESQEDGNKWMEELEKLIDGHIAWRPATSKFQIKLIRDDYDPDLLDTITESEAKNIEFTRPGWDTLISEIILKFADRTTFESNSIKQRNPTTAGAMPFGRTETYDYMMCSNGDTATIILRRLIRKTSYPYATMKFNVSISDYSDLVIGDVIKINFPTIGVTSMVIRIVGIGGDKQDDQNLEIQAIEDEFTVSDIDISTYQVPTPPTMDYSIGTLDNIKVFDAYQEMTSSSSIIPVCTPPTGTIKGVRVYVNNVYKTIIDPDDFGYGTLDAEYAKGDFENNVKEIDDGATGFTITEVSNVLAVAATRAKFQRLGYILILGNDTDGWEAMSFQNCTDIGGGKFTLTNLMRGVMNTEIRTHAAADECWLVYIDVNTIDTISITPGSTIAVKFEAFNDYETAENTENYDYIWTVETPYPPSNLTASRVGNDITLVWEPCKRLAGANYRDPDTIVGGMEEGDTEGEWWVTWDNWTNYVVATTPTYGRTDASSQTYKVKSYLNGHFSDELSIVI
jgi:hypothetical protein